jgi:hypothetical protein
MKPDWTPEYIKERFDVEAGDFVEYTVLRGRRPHASSHVGTVIPYASNFFDDVPNTLRIKPKYNPTNLVKFYNGMISVEVIGADNV